MKKKVLCVFSLLLLALVICTFLSMEIEEEMLLEVIGWNVKCDYADTIPPAIMLFTDDFGSHLYEVYEGTGWESGLRAREVELSGISFRADRDYIIARGASRQPVYNESAQLYDGTDTAPSTYLAVYPNGIPEENEMLYQAEILEQSGHVLLLYVENGVQPFMENRVKGGMVQLQKGGWEVYSLDALKQLLENIPRAAAVFAILLALTLLGVTSCILSRNWERNRLTVCINILLILLLLGLLILALGRIDLPSSLLPADNIFSWSHYKAELADIFAALEDLGGDTLRSCLELHSRMLHDSTVLLTLSSALVFLMTALELFLGFRKKIK